MTVYGALYNPYALACDILKSFMDAITVTATVASENIQKYDRQNI